MDRMVNELRGSTLHRTQDELAGIRGEVLRPGMMAYDRARALYNGIVDRRPAMIVRCAGSEDVVRCVRYARQNDVQVSVRAGGHGVAGNALNDGGLVIDLTAMRGVLIDPTERTARVGGGARWMDLDPVAQRLGLATTGGRVSSTGIAGFTLGGGAGWLMSRFGLACDNLRAATLVTADGGMVAANDDDEPDLMWALRGGGGNLGVVTSFELALHPIEVTLSGLLQWPRSQAREVLRTFRDLAMEAPDELGLVFACVTDRGGRPAITVTVCWTGGLEEGERCLSPLRSLGPPEVDTIGPMPYDKVQKMLDYTGVWGSRNYWKSGYIPQLTDEAMDELVAGTDAMPSPLSAIHLWAHHGEANRVPEDATAFPNRGFPFNLHIIGAWTDPRDDMGGIAWSRELYERMRPHFSDRSYVNFDDLRESARVVSAYGSNYQRLVDIKTRYDPDNMFRSNQNIKPRPAR
ncbi:MAG: FAD-binding oxidoreductase [Methanomassiliicoccus sp.]|nr:FAD-binding oxidoreductase [Methanomassiliicoccus sp.]